MKLEDIEPRAADPASDAIPRKTVIAFGAALALGLLIWAGIYLLIS